MMRYAAMRSVDRATGRTGPWFVPKARYECGHWTFPLDWLNPPLVCPGCGSDLKYVDVRDGNTQPPPLYHQCAPHE